MARSVTGKMRRSAGTDASTTRRAQFVTGRSDRVGIATWWYTASELVGAKEGAPTD